MDKNKKIIILVVLGLVALVVWIPKGNNEKDLKVPLESAQTSFEIAAHLAGCKGIERTRFSEWGRNPFVWPEVEASITAELKLSGVIVGEVDSFAIINGVIVYAGEKIEGKTVKKIEENKVTLTDGMNDYVLSIE